MKSGGVWLCQRNPSACCWSRSTRQCIGNTSGCSERPTREATRLRVERAENAAGEGLVIVHVLREQPELLHLDEIQRAERLAEFERLEGEHLEARPLRLGPLGDQDEVERRPVPPHHMEQRAIAALVLDRDELLGGWAVLHADDVFVVFPVVRALRDPKVRGKILASEAERRVLSPERCDLIPCTPKDGLDQGFGDPALGFQEIHAASSSLRKPAPNQRCCP